ncbi:hypothetical protein JVU11DRAFT_6140 [Chiua virens]|nr:hypothetical protein JVU11DRAFT_6140 [Chiua virens]
MINHQSLDSIYYCVGAGADILISIFMTFLMLRERTSNEFASTAHILHRATVFAVNTGIWPALFALSTITLMYVVKTAPYYVVLAIAICPVYCNTLLANLNARDYIRGSTTPDEIDIDLIADLGSHASGNDEIDNQCRGVQSMSSTRPLRTQETAEMGIISDDRVRSATLENV